MVRRILHVLLALTLALNGISAPWAMTRMSHETHEGHGTPAHGFATTTATPVAAGAHAHHGEHDHGMAVAETEPSTPEPPMDGSCCDGTTCQCGCVLPPVMPLMALVLLSALTSETPLVLPAQHAVVRRGSPPFRPPAV